jgi:hypothetical protein
MEIPSDHYWSMMLDKLVDLDEERLRALDVLIRQKERVAKIYNKKVKSKVFGVGDLVWKVVLRMDRKRQSPWEMVTKLGRTIQNFPSVF